ncbi:MAG: hypothetical protein KF901_08120 [Myxococcales bacterium]|nr:hypothetical protein [Myxococcales bacterium]
MRHHTRLLSLLVVMGAQACGDPPVDDFRSEGGTAPDPTGVIEGAVLYAGPRPECEWEGERAVRIRGRVVLTLFVFDNPPPPTGSASTAENLLVMPASAFFPSLDDCMPQMPTAAQRRTPLIRSAEFQWPEIPLGRDYQIRGFFDYDEDFNPFFSVSNLPTAGDIAGGALVNPSDPSLGFRRIRFGTARQNPNGQVVTGVSVSLGAVVNTERPIFRMETLPLSSEQLLPTTPDAVMREEMLWGATRTRLVMYDRNVENAQTAALLGAMSEGLLSFDPANASAYAWYVRPVDANGDGVQDLHPILGRSAMIPWFFPATIMQRVRSPQELAAGIPAVILIPTVRPTQILSRDVFYPSIDIAVPSVGVLQTALDLRCRFPLIPPGNPAETLEAGGEVTAECSEIPTGYYAVNVLHGLAGGRPIGGEPCEMAAECGGMGVACIMGRCSDTRSESGFNIREGQFSSQAWTLPNPLGDPAQVDNPVTEQGNAALFIVHDPNPEGPTGRQGGRDGCATAPSAEGNRAVDYTDFRNFGEDADEVRDLCCAPIRHLCGLPLCGAGPVDPGDPGGLQLRLSPTEVVDGVPNCVPFEMPLFCCQPE